MISQDRFSLIGGTVFITGLAAGLGRAFAQGCALAGAHVAGTYLESDCGETERLVRAGGRDFRAVRLDLGSPTPAEADALVRDFDRTFHPLTVLVNNAGVNVRREALNYDLEDWQHVLSVNLTAGLVLSQALARVWVERGGKGKIINVGSLLSFQAGFRTAAYTASKHAVAGLTKLLGNEWGPYGINVNCLVPGYIRTRMTEAFISDTSVSEAYRRRIPLGRWGEPGDLVGALIFLASSASDYVQGASVVVDGGYLNS